MKRRLISFLSDAAGPSQGTTIRTALTNFDRVRASEGLPIELIQAIRARTQALNDYTRAVADYNRSQFRLLRAIGLPPSTPHIEVEAVHAVYMESPQ